MPRTQPQTRTRTQTCTRTRTLDLHPAPAAGKAEEYDGPREAKGIVKFVKDALGLSGGAGYPTPNHSPSLTLA